LTTTRPGVLSFNVTFIGQLVVYVLLPAAAIIASVFPEISELLFSWLDLLKRRRGSAGPPDAAAAPTAVAESTRVAGVPESRCSRPALQAEVPHPTCQQRAVPDIPAPL